ncbi:MAG: protoporphyrinogen oxidase [Nitrospirae bacterium]|uniref:Coproporphyrinogen III oxidase n=2 Tax=Nitrospirota TaxID=40117 RepID=A0A142BU32_9BACT|nr:protoporphyrinogen oxidase [Candidatus Magnetobacterium casensis]AIM41301.1 protoporphyrinogen oxidase HemY [Candidatus Magnetobacterium casensis]AMP41620.1 protoporphyrinogen oxidase HemY [uncultured Nitrospirota bacterium]MBF0337236.1 protoporphyrinogen oxidase [Nitrospirota bacterium]
MTVAIVGGGIAGLTVGYLLAERFPTSEIRVFEGQNRPGGKIWTHKESGYLIESAVNGFLDNRPRTLELSARLGLSPVRSNEGARRRYVYWGGRLQRVPEGLTAFVRSDLLSAGGKVRVLMEAFLPPAKDIEDETLASFATRRLGREAYETLIDPMASGIYAGDAQQLSLKACFPKVYNLEANYGGLIRGMLQKMWQSRKTKQTVSAGPGGVLTSFDAGMGSIIDVLSERLGPRLMVGHSAVAVQRVRERYVVHFDAQDPIEADVVILAAPAYASCVMLRELDAQISRELAGIVNPPVSVVCMGIKTEHIKGDGVDGFGFLIPSRAGKKTLGTLFDSTVFPHRAPEGYTLLRTMAGGARNPHIALLKDDDLVSTVLTELSDIIGLKDTPEMIKIYRHEKAIPQYNQGHPAMLDRIGHLMQRHRGLYLHGNSYRGIGVNDCIETSFALVERIAGEMFADV